MIFVTVGMHPRGFERLVREMDKIAGEISEEVIIQIGRTKYRPTHAKYFDFTTDQDIKELCRKARVVVTHGGAGTILDILQEGTTVLAVPRLKKYSEHIDDHQLDLVQELKKSGKITAVYDVQELKKTLLKLDTSPVKLVKDRRLVNALQRYIAQYDNTRK